MADVVANPYKAAVQAARGRVEVLKVEADGALRQVQGLMRAGAWESGSANAFGRELTAYAANIATGTTGCVAACDAVIRAQPDTVRLDSWQIRWHRM